MHLAICVNGMCFHANKTVEAAKKFAAEAEEAARKTKTAEAALAASKAVQGAALAAGTLGTLVVLLPPQLQSLIRC
jgi:hypothetical protein